jgi:hypothetical protein
MAEGVARRIRVNDRGQRIGEGHHMAKLTDAEVDQLIADRGPEDKPLMSYSQLAARYGISKSSVRDYLIGRRRGQAGMTVDKPQPSRPKACKVRVTLRLEPHHRAKLARLGRGAWLARMLDAA